MGGASGNSSFWGHTADTEIVLKGGVLGSPRVQIIKVRFLSPVRDIVQLKLKKGEEIEIIYEVTLQPAIGGIVGPLEKVRAKGKILKREDGEVEFTGDYLFLVSGEEADLSEKLLMSLARRLEGEGRSVLKVVDNGFELWPNKEE